MEACSTGPTQVESLESNEARHKEQTNYKK